jgi:hypothetical protein
MDFWLGIIMKNKPKTPKTGAQYAGTPPVQHPEVVLAQPEPPPKLPEEEKSAQAINDDDIEADRHNGSAGAFEATEEER